MGGHSAAQWEDAFLGVVTDQLSRDVENVERNLVKLGFAKRGRCPNCETGAADLVVLPAANLCLWCCIERGVGRSMIDPRREHKP